VDLGRFVAGSKGHRLDAIERLAEALGNSKDVGKDHYLQVTQDHFARAAKGDLSSRADAIKAAQKTALQPAEEAGGTSRDVTDAEEGDDATDRHCSDLRNDATPCNRRGLIGMGAEGFEPSKA
jgi:hypothetical protein